MLNFSFFVVCLEEAGAEEAEVAESVESAAEEDVAAEAPEVLLETATGEETGTLETVVEEVAETVAETAEVVAEVAGVVAETAEEVAAVAEEVQKVAEEVEAAAEAVVTPVIQAEETVSESNGTPEASQEEAVAEATNTEAWMAHGYSNTHLHTQETEDLNVLYSKMVTVSLNPNMSSLNLKKEQNMTLEQF